MDLIPTNEELMCAYQRGDSKSFEILYQRISGKLYGYLRKRLQRRELVDECFQMVFAKVHKSRSQYDATYTVEQWLYVVARSTVSDHFRKQSREIEIEFEPSVDDLASPESSASISSEGAATVPLDHLSFQQRKVVEWRVLEELSYDEIAKRMDESETNIRQVFSRSLKKLRLAVQKEGKL